MKELRNRTRLSPPRQEIMCPSPLLQARWYFKTGTANRGQPLMSDASKSQDLLTRPTKPAVDVLSILGSIVLLGLGSHGHIILHLGVVQNPFPKTILAPALGESCADLARTQ